MSLYELYQSLPTCKMAFWVLGKGFVYMKKNKSAIETCIIFYDVCIKKSLKWKRKTQIQEKKQATK